MVFVSQPRAWGVQWGGTSIRSNIKLGKSAWPAMPSQPLGEAPTQGSRLSQWLSPGAFAPRQSWESIWRPCRPSQNASFHKTHFLLVLPDGSRGKQKAQEEEADGAAGNTQAEVGPRGGEGGPWPQLAVGPPQGGLEGPSPYWALISSREGPRPHKENSLALGTLTLSGQEH